MSWSNWQQVTGDGFDFAEIVYEKKHHADLEGGLARVTMNKPDKYNAMTLSTVDEMFKAFYDAFLIASAEFLEGKKDVVFPDGSYPPARPFFAGIRAGPVIG